MKAQQEPTERMSFKKESFQCSNFKPRKKEEKERREKKETERIRYSF